MSAPYHKNPLVYYHDTLQLCKTRLDDVSDTKMLTLAFLVLSYSPLIVSDAISCPLHTLKTLWYFIMILHGYIEHILMMCRVQE